MALVVLLCALFGNGIQFLLVAPFLLAGLASGLLQGRAVRSAPAAFLAADSWSAVRAALNRSLPGKLSLGLTWANAIALLLVIALYRPTPTMATVLICYATFMLARELTAIPALHTLNATRSEEDAA